MDALALYSADNMQLDHSFPRKGLLGGWKEGKQKTEADKGRWGGREGQKEAGKGKRVGGAAREGKEEMVGEGKSPPPSPCGFSTCLDLTNRYWRNTCT